MSTSSSHEDNSDSDDHLRAIEELLTKELESLDDVVKLAKTRMMLRGIARDEEWAWREFLVEYGPTVRAMARRQLAKGPLRRMIDSEDIQQSVLAVLVRKLKVEEVDPRSVRQFIGFLDAIVKNRYRRRLQFHFAQKRDFGRSLPIPIEHLPCDHPKLCDEQIDPSVLAIVRETETKFYEQRSDRERWLIHERHKGTSWKDIAVIAGCTPDAARVRYSRLTKLLWYALAYALSDE